MPNHAAYDYAVIEGDQSLLIINDLNKGSKSVTNDIEYVIEKLKEKGLIIESRRVIYRDSEGTYSEIKIDKEGNFAGFMI